MRIYRIIWRVVWGSLALVGASVAFILSPPTLAFLFLMFAALGGMLPLSIIGDYKHRALPERARLITSYAMVGGTTAGAFVGFAIWLGAGVFLLVLFFIMSSPYAMSAYTRWLNSAPTPSAAQIDALARALAYTSPEYIPLRPPSELEMFTNEQLCQGWRSSFLALQERSSSTKVFEAVADRQRYLDEFERRNPSGFAAWLASGARAPGNPLPYLTRDRVDTPAINWDELTRGQDY
jgi:hypothetical protein